ncbi:MAG: hypothetical protein A2177_13750 [Spirochaetes bacterium RBG_13_68_11]|nr:MAG: hypothetical protein A2177_13750 [Spirochaetes bacterium RBG_13_68_11]
MAASTPGPTDSTTPDHSWPGMDGKPVRSQPAIILRSVAQMLQKAVRMRACPRAGTGAGSSRSSSAPGPVLTIALTAASVAALRAVRKADRAGRAEAAMRRAGSAVV